MIAAIASLWEWLGLGGNGEKTGLDLFQTLGTISIPIVAAILTAYFTLTQGTREQTAEDIRKDTEIAVEERRAENQRQTEEKRATNEALQGYFDDMTQLMLTESQLTGKQLLYVKELKQSRTLTILSRFNSELLDAESKKQGKRSVVQFLYESGMIGYSDRKGGGICPAFISLDGADLTGLSAADLREFEEGGATLRHAMTDPGVSPLPTSPKPVDQCASAGPRDVEIAVPGWEA